MAVVNPNLISDSVSARDLVDRAVPKRRMAHTGTLHNIWRVGQMCQTCSELDWLSVRCVAISVRPSCFAGEEDIPLC